MSENTNKQVRFLTGTQSALNGMSASQVGTFYLTNDTNRLYVGTESGKPALVNKVVEVVDNLNGLPVFTSDADKTAHLNDFYYVKDKNILCVYTNTDTSAPWTQINPDTDTYVEVTELSVGDADKSEQGKIKYTITLKQEKFNANGVEGAAGTPLDDKTATFTIDGDSLASIVPEAASVGLTAKNETSGVTIKTSGAGAGDGEISIVNTDNVKVEYDDDNDQVKISAAKYDLTGDIDQGTDEIKLYLSHDMEAEGAPASSVVTIDLTYLKDYADSKFAAVGNPLHYKGTVASLNILQALTAPAIGDMYKANPVGSDVQEGVFESGDVFIYYNNTWERIPSGDDLVDTLYQGKMVDNTATKIKFGIQEQGGAEGSTKTVGDNLELNIGDKLSYDPLTKTLSHEKVNETGEIEITTPDSASANDGFTVYTPTLDDYGHITAVTAQPYTVTNTNTTYSLTNDDSTKTFTLKGSDNAEGAHDGSITLKEAANSSIAITSTTSSNATTYSFDLVWGTF